MSKCACINASGRAFDIDIEYTDCKSLKLTDFSEWMEDDNYIIPTSYPIEVETPTGARKQLTFYPKTSKKYTVNELVGKNCLTDGIYCFTVDSCGRKYSKSFAVLCELECKLQEMVYKQASGELEKSGEDKIPQIKNFIEISKAQAKLGNSKKANEFYKTADKILSQYNCSCSCQ